jgi:hypothetical protein
MATWIVLGSVMYMHRRELGVAWRCVCAGARVGWEKWVERGRCVDDEEEEEEERETRIVDVKAFRMPLFTSGDDGAGAWIDHWRVLNDGEGREDEEEEGERRSGVGEDGAGLSLSGFTLEESDDDEDDSGNDDGAGACIDQWRDPPVAVKISDEDDDEEVCEVPVFLEETVPSTIASFMQKNEGKETYLTTPISHNLDPIRDITDENVCKHFTAFKNAAKHCARDAHTSDAESHMYLSDASSDTSAFSSRFTASDFDAHSPSSPLPPSRDGVWSISPTAHRIYADLLDALQTRGVDGMGW